MERILRTMKGLSGFNSKQYQPRGLSKSTKFTFKDTSSAASDDIFHVMKATSLKAPIPQKWSNPLKQFVGNNRRIV